MTDDYELRLKIAELKGWKVLDMKVAPCWNGSGYVELPNWPTDISAAFELVAELQAEPHEQSFQMEHTPALRPTWAAQIGLFCRVGDTPARAICLAYIAWKEANR